MTDDAVIDILAALARVELAVSCAKSYRADRREHLAAALSATGDLQRALILARLAMDRPMAALRERMAQNRPETALP